MQMLTESLCVVQTAQSLLKSVLFYCFLLLILPLTLTVLSCSITKVSSNTAFTTESLRVVLTAQTLSCGSITCARYIWIDVSVTRAWLAGSKRHSGVAKVVVSTLVTTDSCKCRVESCSYAWVSFLYGQI